MTRYENGFLRLDVGDAVEVKLSQDGRFGVGRIVLIGETNQEAGNCGCCSQFSHHEDSIKFLGNVFENPSLLALCGRGTE